MSETVPPDYKHALITTIIKKHTLDPETLNNYRPISNLSIFSKTLECVLNISLITLPLIKSSTLSKVHTCQQNILKQLSPE